MWKPTHADFQHLWPRFVEFLLIIEVIFSCSGCMGPGGEPILVAPGFALLAARLYTLFNVQGITVTLVVQMFRTMAMGNRGQWHVSALWGFLQLSTTQTSYRGAHVCFCSACNHSYKVLKHTGGGNTCLYRIVKDRLPSQNKSRTQVVH